MMRNRWNNVSLRTQLSLALMLIMLVLLMIFSAVIYVSVRGFLINQTASQLREQADSAIATVLDTPTLRDGRGKIDSRRLQAIADTLSSRTTSVVIYQNDGDTLATGRIALLPGDSGPLVAAVPPPAPRFGPRPGRWNRDQYIAIADGSPQVTVLVPMEDSRLDENVVVQLATPFQPIALVLRRVMALLVAGVVVVTALAFLLGRLATRAITRPLGQVITVSHAVAAGDLQARTGLQARNEVGLLGAAFDHMVDQVQGSFATQRRFVADAAHELRTPLTTLGGSVELMMMGAVSDPARQRTTLQRMLSEIERMTRLVNDLLTLSRLDARPEMRIGTVALDALARDVVQQARQLAPDHQIAFESTPVQVPGDADRLRQVLVNLVDNARKYTPAGGSIAVHVERAGGYGRISISDTGVGIPATDVPHVWDRFYRVDQARARATGGVGLGLAIVKGIIEAHHGVVQLSSAPGTGTTVTVDLPLHGTPTV